MPSSSARIKHNTLQTLFFPDRLEPKLASIHSAARALQEDAGLSALYFQCGVLRRVGRLRRMNLCLSRAALSLPRIGIVRRLRRRSP